MGQVGGSLRPWLLGRLDASRLVGPSGAEATGLFSGEQLGG